MKHEQNGSGAAPSRSPGATVSMFQASIEKMAASRGISVADALAAERDAALAAGGPGDECLLPDEVDSLLASPNLHYVHDELQVRRGRTPTEAETEALDHIHQCDFCPTLIRIAQPRVAQRNEFLRVVRAEAEARRAAQAGGTGGAASLPAYAPLSPLSPLFPLSPMSTRLVYWPLALLVLALAGAATLALSPKSTFVASYAQAWPQVVGAGFVGAIVALLCWYLADMLKPDRPRLSARVRSTGPVLVTSLGAFVTMAAAAGAAAYRVDRGVTSLQADAVQSAAHALTKTDGGVGPQVASAAFKPCAGATTGAPLRYCSSVEGGTGDVVLEVSAAKDRADIYWVIRGKKLREFKVELAEIRGEPGGAKSVALHSGGETPLSSAAASQYEDGERVLAILRSPMVVRLAGSLPALDEHAGKFALMRTSLPAKH